MGDLVGFGPSPNEVVDLIRRRGITGVLGNIDRDCLRLAAADKDASTLSLKQAMYAWTWRQLSPANRRHLQALPEQFRLDAAGKSVLLVHGSPDSLDEYIEEGISDERLGELARQARADVVVAGHSHKPFVARAGGTFFVNAGSVGRPDAGGGRSCYALLTAGPAGVRVKYYKPRYDIEATIAAVRQAGLSEAFARMIRTGEKLKQAQAALFPQTAPATAVPPEVHRFAGAFGDVAHSRHVTALALNLFDQLAPALDLNAHDRFLLECGSLVHDVGWRGGQAGHHKESMRMILAEGELGLSEADRLVVANIARYHRRALPTLAHAHFRWLDEPGRKRVRLLGGLLRLADALDCQHGQHVRQVALTLTGKRLLVACRSVGEAAPERLAAHHKSDLLAEALGRRIDLDWNTISG